MKYTVRIIPLEIYDCGFYDIGTNNTKESSWYNSYTALEVSYSTLGRTITNVDSSATNRHYYYNDASISTVKISGMNTLLNNTAIEFNVTAINGTVDVYLTDTTNNKSIGLTSTGAYKITIDGTRVHLFKDGVEQTLTGSVAMNGNNIRFSFLLNTTNESITFKDFKIYSI